MNKNLNGQNIKTKEVLNLFWRTSLEHKKSALLSIALPISQVVLGVAVPFYAGRAIANVISYDESMKSFWLLLLSTVAGLILNFIGIRNNMIMQSRSMSSLHRKAHDKLLSKNIGFFNNNIGGKLVSDIIDMPNSYSVLVNSAYIKATGFILTVIIGLIVLFISSPLLASIVSSLLAVVTYLTIRDSKKRSDLRRKRMLAYKKLTAHTSDTIVNAQTIKAFATEKYEQEQNNILNDKLAAIRKHDWVRTVTNESFRISIVSAIQIIVILTIILISRNNPNAIASGIFAFTYSITVTNRFLELNTIIRMVEESLIKSLPMIEIMLEENTINDIPNAPKLKITDAEVNIKNVSFYYPDSSADQKVISGLSLKIKPGEKIGLVGKSGGGKSTIVKLLLRFEDVNSGEIEIDGQNISKVSQESLRQSIAYVPQEPILFHRSIKDNINYGSDSKSDLEMKRATDLANATEFIEQLPNGYDTIVGERGVKLSGGQRQRIAIARAMLKNAPILLLDEATSALDSESEAYVQKALNELMKNKTVIVIAHRLSTIRKMDRIIVIDNGSIIEEGSHNHLIEKNGKYARLWAHQSGDFIEE